MNPVVKFLTENPIFYLATVEEGQPRVRPFGAVVEWDNKTYICTNNKKGVFQQITKNPKVEISATSNDGKWIRITGNAIADPRKEAKEAMLEANPGLKNMYSVDDEIFEVLYLENATAVINSFSGEKEVITLS